jgi:hypothetical protein
VDIDMSDPIKDRVRRQLESLSPEEVQAVHELIRTFKDRSSGEDERPPSAPAPAARRVRVALAGLPGALSDAIAEERRDRV